jgi:four helix bundle protein
MSIYSYQELIVWQKAMDLTVQIYKITTKLPKEELFSLTNQMRKAAVSIPSNIAEGQARHSRKEFLQFIGIAKGSKAELETQLLLCQKIGYLFDTDISEAMNLLQEVGKMLNALARKLRQATNNYPLITNH